MDHNAAISAVAAALSDDDRRLAMGVKCRTVAVAEYSLDVQARAYAALYEQLSARAGAAARGTNPVVAAEPIVPRVSPTR